MSPCTVPHPRRRYHLSYALRCHYADHAADDYREKSHECEQCYNSYTLCLWRILVFMCIPARLPEVHGKPYLFWKFLLPPTGIEETHLPNTQYALWKHSFIMIWYHRQANTHTIRTLKTQFWYAALRICAYLLSLDPGPPSGPPGMNITLQSDSAVFFGAAQWHITTRHQSQ